MGFFLRKARNQLSKVLFGSHNVESYRRITATSKALAKGENKNSIL